MLLTLRIWLWRARPALAVVGLVALVLVGARVAAPAPAPSTPVVVLAHDVEAGTALGDDDLRLADLPEADVPVGSSGSASDWRGRTVAVALPAGLPVVPGVLAGSRFTVTPPTGSVVVAVPADGGSALRPGDRVDLIPAACAGDPPAGSGTVAGVLVVEVDDGGSLIAADRAAAARVVELVQICTLVPVLVE